jgi:anti-sigma-K factor RskA
MNIQAYIESGILEEYVLGTVSPQEKQEVECMSHIYPEIREELLRTEDALEQYALKYQTPPPPSLKDSLFAQMNFDEASAESDQIDEVSQPDGAKTILTTKEIVPVGDRQEPVKGIRDGSAVVETRIVTSFWAKLSIAASVLLALFAGWSASQVSGMRKVNQEQAYEMETVKRIYAYKESLATLYRSPDYRVVKMAGIPAKSPESNVAAFWNRKTNEVLLDVQSLPAAPAGKQYQLWSIVDGVPVDIGMLETPFEGKVLRMKPAKTGSVAFAITLENEGGSPTPTMEEMYVMGKV